MITAMARQMKEIDTAMNAEMIKQITGMIRP